MRLSCNLLKIDKIKKKKKLLIYLNFIMFYLSKKIYIFMIYENFYKLFFFGIKAYNLSFFKLIKISNLKDFSLISLYLLNPSLLFFFIF
jgi:hypothetical protein